MDPSRTFPARRGRTPSSRGSFGYLLVEAVRVLRAALIATRRLRGDRFAVVLSNSSLATILVRALAAPVQIVYYVHDSLYSEPAHGPRSERLTRYLANDVIERAALRRADWVILPSEGVAAQAREARESGDRISVVYPFLDGRGVPTSSVGPLPATGRFLLTVGQQTGRKRVDLLLRALADLPDDLHLVVVGNGPLHAAYIEQAQIVGLSTRVLFLPNASDDDVARLYEACAAFVLASENEGFPITVAEALRAGAPVALVCPATSALGAVIGAPHIAVTTELTVEGVVKAVRSVLVRDDEEMTRVRRAIRERSATLLPDERAIRAVYAGIFERLRRAGS